MKEVLSVMKDLHNSVKDLCVQVYQRILCNKPYTKSVKGFGNESDMWKWYIVRYKSFSDMTCIGDNV